VKTKLTPQDLFLLGLAVVGDILEEYLVGGSNALRYSKLNWYFPPGYKKAHYTKTLYNKIKAKQINKDINQKNKQLTISLTQTGSKYLQERFPLALLQQNKWDKKWCLATFDIPESQRYIRNKIRKKLQQVGFAQLQKSLYISPHPINSSLIKLINNLNLAEQVLVFQGKQKHFKPSPEVINQLWKLDDIKQNYLQIIKSSQKKLGSINQQKIIQSYLNTVAKDPHLPFELLSTNWPAKKAKQAIKNLTQPT